MGALSVTVEPALPRAVRAAHSRRHVRGSRRRRGARGRGHRRARPRSSPSPSRARAASGRCPPEFAAAVARVTRTHRHAAHRRRGAVRPRAAPARPFHFQAFGWTPDLVSVGKAIGSGVPVGAALVSERVAAQIFAGDHGTTYGGNLLAMRAALYVLEQFTGTADAVPYASGGLIDHVRAGRRGLRRAPRGPSREARRSSRACAATGVMRGPRAHHRRGAGRRGRAQARAARQPHRRARGADAAAVHRRRAAEIDEAVGILDGVLRSTSWPRWRGQ